MTCNWGEVEASNLQRRATKYYRGKPGRRKRLTCTALVIRLMRITTLVASERELGA